MPAATVSAGVSGAALADLAAAIDSGLPGFWRDAGERAPLPLAQLPADGVDQLAPGPGDEIIQPLDQPVTGSGTITGDHQPPPVLRRTAAIAASSTVR